MNQKSFFERLLIDCNQATGLEIGFPQEYTFDNFVTLKSDLESLANKYGLTIPAKLKRGKLIFELKTVDQAVEIKKSTKPISVNHPVSLRLPVTANNCLTASTLFK